MLFKKTNWRVALLFCSLKKSYTKELFQLTKDVFVKPQQLFDAAEFVKTSFSKQRRWRGLISLGGWGGEAVRRGR